MQRAITAPRTAPLPWGTGAAAAILVYVLFAEWLRPLLEMSHVTEIYMLKPFLIAFGCFLAIDYLRVPEWAGWLIKSAAIFMLTGWLFHPDSVADFGWPAMYADIVMRDFAVLTEQGPAGLGPETRTILFLFGWAVLLQVVYASVRLRRRALWFTALTIVYLSLLQLWPGLDTTAGLIRVFVCGTALAVLLRVQRLALACGPGFRVPYDSALRWGVVAVCLAGALAALGMYGARETNGMAKPVELASMRAALERAAGAGGATGVSVIPASAARTGYGWDDSRLGGALTKDAGIALLAVSEAPVYWRAESKDIYDGKGWTASRGSEPSVPFAERYDERLGGMTGTGIRGSEEGSIGGSAAVRPGDGMQVRTESVTVVDEALSGILFASGPIVRIEELLGADGNAIPESAVYWQPSMQRYVVRVPDNGTRLAAYRLQVAAAEGALSSSPGPETLGLPQTLPTRVLQLASEVTAGSGNAWAKATAIESYLRMNYTYRLDVKTGSAPRGGDFADEFLFVTKEGYCDHFSTAMAVLLRASGVHARWVKGFAVGDPLPEGNKYAIRNLHAHSWVEAYIPGRGWVSFEPTPAYGEGASASAAAAADTAHAAGAAAPLRTLSERARDLLLLQLPAQLPNAPAVWGAAAALLAVLAALALRLPRQLRRAAGVPPLPQDPALRDIDRTLRRMLRRYGERRPNQTLREYEASLKLADAEQLASVKQFLRLYEQARYGPAGGAALSQRKLRELWRRMSRSRRPAGK